MAAQPDFAKDAMAFFDMIDNFGGGGCPKRKPGKILIYREFPKQDQAAGKMMNHLEAAKRFGGIVIKDPVGKGNRG